MKKKLFAIISFIFCLAAVVFVGNVKPVESYAADDDMTITESTVIDDSYFDGDNNAYTAIKRIAERIKTENGQTEGLNTLRAGDLSSVKTLDLTYERVSITFTLAVGGADKTINFYEDTGEEGWSNIRCRFTSTMGLESLIYGSNFGTLILDNNYIETIDSDLFGNMSHLRNLSVKNNRLTAVNIPLSIPIQKLNLEGNLITSIDLSCLQQRGETPAECHLENNNFTKVSDITLPAVTSTKVNLYLAQNYLTDARKSDFGGHNVSLLIQGIKKDANIRLTANTYIRVTSDMASEGFIAGEQLLTAKAYYRSDSSFYVEDAEPVSISDSEGKLVLPAGKLVIKFYNGGEEYTTGNFVAKNIDIYPNPPTIGVEKDGKILEEIPKAIKGAFKVIVFSPSPDAVMEIRFSNTDWEKGNVIDVKESGSYIIYARTTIDGLASDSSYIIIQNTDSTRMTWTLIIVIGAVILVVGGLYLYRWYKGGAIVAPLTDKEIADEQRRQHKKQIKNNTRQDRQDD